MKKLLFLLLVSFIATPLIVHQASAASVIQNPQIQALPNFLGQDHNYSVTFRGNGEAIVIIRTIFSNLKDDELSTLSLRVPKVDPKDISVYQVIREPKCIRYQGPQLPTLPSPEELQQYKQQGISPSLPTPLLSPTTKDLCEEYQQPDYYQYWDTQTKYKKADYRIQGDTIGITLPEKISASGSGSIILYYRAIGYAKKNLYGAYEFTFETLKVDDRVRNLQIGINTDSDLFLRGEQGKVDYRFDEGLMSLKAAGSRDDAVKSQQIDSFYQQIGQGSIVKTASNLQPLDSYILKGSFAQSRFSLYAKDIIKWLVAIILVISILGLLTRYIIKKLKHTSEAAIGNKSLTRTGFNIGLFGGVAGLSFVVSILILGYTLFVFLIQQFINSLYYYQYNMLISIFLIIISIGVYGLLLLAPPIFLAIRRGIKWAIILFVLTVCWLLFYLIIFIVFSFLLSPNPYNPMYGGTGPVMMEKSTETVPLSK